MVALEIVNSRCTLENLDLVPDSCFLSQTLWGGRVCGMKSKPSPPVFQITDFKNEKQMATSTRFYESRGHPCSGRQCGPVGGFVLITMGP